MAPALLRRLPGYHFGILVLTLPQLWEKPHGDVLGRYRCDDG